MRDGPVRRGLKWLALGWFRATVGVDRALAKTLGRDRYALGGACVGCGACCESPSIRVGWVTWFLPTLRRAFLAWQAHVNGFELVETDRTTRSFTFRCSHFDRATRRCDSYASRPGMCRDYPRVHLYEARPEFLPGCGYRPVARDTPETRRLLRVITEQPMDEAQRERLKKQLFLE